jgi:pimeloyl-ACP methyl ester carboxylesterase
MQCPRTLGENPYSARFAAKLMFGMLDRLGLDDLIVVSHSLGAQVL